MKTNWTKQQISILSVVSITSFLGTFLISSINIALPSIGKNLGLNAVSLSWVVTAFLLSTAMFLLPVGRWADDSGIYRLYKIGLIIFAVASLLNAFAPTGGWLILFRFLQGIGAAFTNVTGSAIVVSAFPPQQRGKVLGISVSSVYLGLAFGPFVGGILTQSLGWRSIFMASAIVGFISIIIAYLFLGKEQKQSLEIKKRDIKGTLLYMLGLICLVYGSSKIPSVLGEVIMLAGVIFLTIFWKVETKSESPLLNTQLYTRNKLFAFSNLAALINYGATSAIVFFLSLYLQKIMQMNARHAGMILVAQPIMMTIFSPLVGRLSDKFQPRYFASLGMLMCAVGLGFMAFFNLHSPVWLIVSVLLWVGLGFAFFSSPNMSTIMGSVEKSQYGQASGSASAMRVLGQISSMTIVTLLFATLFAAKTVQDVPNDIFLQAMKIGFLFFSLICFIGIYFSFNRGNVKRN